MSRDERRGRHAYGAAVVLVVLAVAVVPSAHSQDSPRAAAPTAAGEPSWDTGAPDATAQPSPYAGFQERPIKALSADDVEGYLAGRGMGLAMPAELNGYPGPKHVLELAEELALTAKQREEVRAIFDRMHRAAVEQGKEYVALEQRLDALFAGGAADADSLAAVLAAIGGVQARLRLAHLRAHVETKPLLSPEQIARYAELRGYSAPEGGPRHEHRHHGH